MTTKLKLNTPLNDGSIVITDLEFQPLKAKHIKQMPTDDNQMMSYLFTLAATLTGNTTRVMDELSAEDTFRVLEVIKGFFPDSLKTGKIG